MSNSITICERICWFVKVISTQQEEMTDDDDDCVLSGWLSFVVRTYSIIFCHVWLFNWSKLKWKYEYQFYYIKCALIRLSHNKIWANNINYCCYLYSQRGASDSVAYFLSTCVRDICLKKLCLLWALSTLSFKYLYK